jgi:succinylglutamate desuccinylase
MLYKSLELIEYFKLNEIQELSHTIKISSGNNANEPVIVFGLATHGNEPCGVIAAYEFLNEYKKLNIKLNYGTVYFSLINPAAFILNKRLKDDNMNRVFSPNYPFHNSSEIERAGEIKQFLETLNFDAFIDIHSMFPSDNQMILLSGKNYQKSLEFAKKVTNINDVLVEDIDNGHLHTFAKKILCSQNKKPDVFLVECGLHEKKKHLIAMYPV